MTLAAYGTNLRRRSPVNVHLPVERCQRGEVVGFVTVPIEPHPGQSVAAMNAARMTFAQAALAIVDCGLRNRPKGDPLECPCPE